MVTCGSGLEAEVERYNVSYLSRKVSEEGGKGTHPGETQWVQRREAAAGRNDDLGTIEVTRGMVSTDRVEERQNTMEGLI